MLYAWINENGTLCTTFELQSVPEQFRDSVTVFENLDIQDYDRLYVEDGQIKEKTEDIIVQEMKEKLLSELNQYTAGLLQVTDWVVVKLNSLILEGKSETEIQAEKSKYTDVFSQRAEIRSKHSVKENQIMQAESLSELSNLDVRYMEEVIQ